MSARRVAALILIVVLALAGVLVARMVAAGQGNASGGRPGPPASILDSSMLPQEFPSMVVRPGGEVYVGGAGIERLIPGHRATKVLDLPRTTISQTRMPEAWVVDAAMGAGVVAAMGEAIGTWPTPRVRAGTAAYPHGASTLVAWRTLPGGPVRYLLLGGRCNASRRAIAVDRHGNILVTGVTTSDNFPVRHAAQATFAGSTSSYSCPRSRTGLQDGDVFLTRLDPRGRITYSTYLGGSDAEEPRAMAMDRAGNMYVAGLTYSSDFPHVRGFTRPGHGPVCFRDQAGNPHYCWRNFVVKLDPAGRLQWVRMLNLGSDSGEIQAMAVDRQGVYLVGDTVSGDLPTVRAAQSSYGGGSCQDYDGMSIRCRDAWVTKLSPSGRVAFTTYLGGSGDDVGTAIAVGPKGAIYVGGTTDSTDGSFPRLRNVNGAPGGSGHCSLPTPCGDGYVTELTAAGRVLGSWAIGGPGNENLQAIGVDARGRVYVSGDTESCDFPVRHGQRLHQSRIACPATFVAKLQIR